jgi:AcrR family transcriptional regulator
MSPQPDLRWIRPPHQARSQETLERILDAAEGLISEKGFEDATIQDIVGRAGSSVGAFYTRFRDKDGLLHAIYERYLEQAMATTDDALEPSRWDGLEVPALVEAVVHFLVQIYRERRGLIRAFVLRNYTDSDFQARQERLSHYVNEKLAALLLARREEIRHPDPDRAAAFGLTLIFSAIESAVLFGELRTVALAFSDSDLATELTRAYLAYLGVRAPHEE